MHFGDGGLVFDGPYWWNAAASPDVRLRIVEFSGRSLGSIDIDSG